MLEKGEIDAAVLTLPVKAAGLKAYPTTSATEIEARYCTFVELLAKAQSRIYLVVFRADCNNAEVCDGGEVSPRIAFRNSSNLSPSGEWRLITACAIRTVMANERKWYTLGGALVGRLAADGIWFFLRTQDGQLATGTAT